MVHVTADFVADLLALARCELLALYGREAVEQISNDEILMRWRDSSRRRPAVGPRRLLIADDFVCPEEEKSAWDLLKAKIVSGDDLAPHFSSGHINLGNWDGLLNEWDVHHLHLGTKPHTGHPDLVRRTSRVLLARITPDTFFGINIYPHGSWESLTIIESLHRNWPDSVKGYRLNGVSGEPLTDTQRRNIRRVNAQAPVAVADGTVYAPIGGGVSCVGVSMQAVMEGDMLKEDVERLQMFIQEHFDNFIPQLAGAGYKNEPDVRAVLVGITPEGFEVHFPDYGRPFNLVLRGG